MFLPWLLTACVEEYFPDEDNLTTGTIVVDAPLIDVPQRQFIRLSKSSTLLYPKFDPLTGCFVEVESEDGDTRVFEESNPGFYSCNLDEDFLRTGRAYRLVFITPEGEHYESEYETIYPSPRIDSVYFRREKQPDRETGETEDGIRFYMDFEVEKDSGRYLRWQLIETYEIHNPEYQAYIYDVDRIFRELPDSSSWRTCWITSELHDIYTRDIGNLDGAHYRSLPLNFVSNRTRQLEIRYSLLVRQLALGEKEYWYWDNLGKNLQSNDQLFYSQPALTPGNLCNLEDTDELVLGYFSISGVYESRIFVEDVPGLRIEKDPNYCLPGPFPKFLTRFHDAYLPVYLSTAFVDGERQTGEVRKYCVDCRDYKGSTHIKPDFWPD